MNYLRSVFFFLVIVILSGCAITNINSSPQCGCPHHCDSWGISLFANNTEVPQAGSRAMSMTAGVLRTKGIFNLAVYQPFKNCNQLLVCPNTPVCLEEVMHWATCNNIHYIVMGSVNEWQYKVGLDGEPVVSVSIQVYDVSKCALIWSSVGSMIGTTRTGLGNAAQCLIDNMLCSFKVR